MHMQEAVVDLVVNRSLEMDSKFQHTRKNVMWAVLLIGPQLLTG